MMRLSKLKIAMGITLSACLPFGSAPPAAAEQSLDQRELPHPSANAGVSRPNILFLLADQWRFEAFGFAGNPDVKTPNLDRLQREAVHFVNAVSGMPVCSPYRASLLTGQRPLSHGVFVNDVPLDPAAVSIGKVLRQAGYDTGYIGKWHLNNHGRSNFIPRERRHGFDYWKVLECTHDYSNSFYYADSSEKLKWEGYDAIAQTKDAQGFLRDRSKKDSPFFLVLSWGPPHDPYMTAPKEFATLYNPSHLTLRANVTRTEEANARRILSGYYAHCSALDECVGELRRTLEETALAENTILVFTSDHGDMLGSHGQYKKQRPYDESIRVPLLVCWPKGLGRVAKELPAPINVEDVMPTLLGLCGVAIPPSVEGLDFSGYLRHGKEPGDGSTVIRCITPFGEWERRNGGKEYRGLRTQRHTYVRDRGGPWLLFDNHLDPCQTNNLVNLPAHAQLQARLDRLLTAKLWAQKDDFAPGEIYLAKWGYKVNEHGTVPYSP